MSVIERTANGDGGGSGGADQLQNGGGGSCVITTAGTPLDGVNQFRCAVPAGAVEKWGRVTIKNDVAPNLGWTVGDDFWLEFGIDPIAPFVTAMDVDLVIMRLDNEVTADGTSRADTERQYLTLTAKLDGQLELHYSTPNPATDVLIATYATLGNVSTIFSAAVHHYFAIRLVLGTAAGVGAVSQLYHNDVLIATAPANTKNFDPARPAFNRYRTGMVYSNVGQLTAMSCDIDRVHTGASRLGLPGTVGPGDPPDPADVIQATIGTATGLAFPEFPGGTAKAYELWVATVPAKTGGDVSGGGLTWSETANQLNGDGSGRLQCFEAFGSPSAAFSPIFNHLDTAGGILGVGVQMDGVPGASAMSGYRRYNANGENGAGTGGSVGTAVSGAITSTVANTTIMACVLAMDATATAEADYAPAIAEAVLSGVARIVLFDYAKPAAGADTATITLSVARHWALILNLVEPQPFPTDPGDPTVPSGLRIVSFGVDGVGPWAAIDWNTPGESTRPSGEGVVRDLLRRWQGPAGEFAEGAIVYSGLNPPFTDRLPSAGLVYSWDVEAEAQG